MSTTMTKPEMSDVDGWGGFDQYVADRRYQRAKALVERWSEPGRNDPPELKAVWRHIRRVKFGQRLNRKCGPEDLATGAAFRLHERTFARQLIRGLVLAGAEVADIAAELHVPEDVIEAYETVFWQVRSLLGAQGAVGVVIDSSAHDDQERESLQIAYWHGKEAFLQVIGARKMEAETIALLQGRAESRLLCQAVLVSRLPVRTEKEAARVMRDCFKMLDLKAKDVILQAKDVTRRAKLASRQTDVRVQRSQVRAQQAYLREQATRVVEYEKGLAEREKYWATIVAAAQETLRQQPEPGIAAPHLAALRESDKAPSRRRAVPGGATGRKAG